MTADPEPRSLRWRTLADIAQQYRTRLRWDEFLSVTKMLDTPCLEKIVSLAKTPPITSQDLLRNFPDEALKELDRVREQTALLNLHIMHKMIDDAAAGVWFALAKSDVSPTHQLIDPKLWRSLLLDAQKGIAWREPSLRFEDLRCANTTELPRGHPLAKAIHEALYWAGSPPRVQSPPLLADSSPPDIRSGKPGRPSPADLYMFEFQRRVQEGLLEKGQAQQARVLHRWFLITYPDFPVPDPGTIQNNIRKAYNEAIKTAGPTK